MVSRCGCPGCIQEMDDVCAECNRPICKLHSHVDVVLLAGEISQANVCVDCYAKSHSLLDENPFEEYEEVYGDMLKGW